ncbi:1214_t:CDS:10 [Funneliformis caledonium]|uniref:Translation initiation factor eIF2B subunit epsilon n=1 Tax=Funneliformis caledonium TaxID=1117310 RepID=A0A9N9AJ98_9GLOM|nr:1214_t:CDS:10 [Funneliformis caledonium]
MAPKSTGKNIEAETVLQAVVLADSFNERFNPITLDMPRCLLPLCNTPLIEYTLEFLAVAGVQEVYLFCREHSEKVKNYVKTSKWNRSYSPFKIITIVTPEARSVGDALRELDSKQLINSDFILISGDVVSNIHLKQVLDAHRARKNTDKNAIMTMVVKEASPFHRSRALGESSIFVLDGKSQECVHYESVELYPRKRRMVMDMQVFEKHSDVQIRNDLIDCQIDICSVPALFTENFDYQDIRKDFVYGILTSDLLGKTIYCHMVKDAYAARVRSLQTYDAISKDILSRWTYPIVPDSNLQEGDSYEYMRGQIYKEQDVSLSRSCVLGEKVLIGAGTEIAENVKITNSVIGRRVSIGPNVTIDGAYIWDGVTINANCSISRSILTNNVVLEENVIVNKGCLLTYDVIIGPNITLPPYTKLTSHKQTSENDDGDISEEDESGNQKAASFDISNLSLTDNESSASVISDGSSEEESDFDGPTTLEVFSKEVTQTLERAFSEGHTVEIASLELNTLRMASNTTFHDTRTVVIPTIFGQINTDKLLPSTKDVLSRWGLLIGKLVHSKADQIDALFILQECCAKSEIHNKTFAPSLRILYEIDVIEEDAILEWYYDERSKGGVVKHEAYSKLRDAHESFKRKPSDWDILDFLMNVIRNLSSQRVGFYLTSLETIIKTEEGAFNVSVIQAFNASHKVSVGAQSGKSGIASYSHKIENISNGSISVRRKRTISQESKYNEHVTSSMPKKRNKKDYDIRDTDGSMSDDELPPVS